MFWLIVIGAFMLGGGLMNRVSREAEIKWKDETEDLRKRLAQVYDDLAVSRRETELEKKSYASLMELVHEMSDRLGDDESISEDRE
ncbi:hypothetical protein AX760_13655 [Pararhizobium antarcticum]|uniref:Uncharacterized protein n=2 Tax=Pararhizobium antarcticum TaxID=1798805 RepID=A0A657LVF9_9HYPH|nr:hypothetical protein AX761_23190 [Rhizobium sp. 58]OJF99253.1 hypothetical protein AX760_13655 [Pararhizobium antarcticum]